MTQTSFGPSGFTGNGTLRISGGVSGGVLGYIPRTIQWGHNGSTNQQTININIQEFSFNQTGGAFFVGGHGWQVDRFYSMIDYQNGGSSGGITNVRVNDFITQTGMSLAASITGTTQITLQLTNTHTNGHGWQVYIWGPR